MKLTKPTNKRLPPGGLYAVTDPGLIPFERLREAVAQAIAGGAVMIQYRNKDADAAQREQEALILRDACAHHQVPLIINDDARLAHRIGAAGVHLGKDDMPLREARDLLGDAAVIGVSCYNEFQTAYRAQQGGADYVAFGSFFPTTTKADTVRATLDLLHEARQHLSIPIVAIGGITPENGQPLVHAGADFIAASRGVFEHTDVASAARKYAHLFAHAGKTFVV
jgi:thiamine-phosphate pyrophosphorylase